MLLGLFSVGGTRSWWLALRYHQYFQPNKSQGVIFDEDCAWLRGADPMHFSRLYGNLSATSNTLGNDHMCLQAAIHNFGRVAPIRKCVLGTVCVVHIGM